MGRKKIPDNVKNMAGERVHISLDEKRRRANAEAATLTGEPLTMTAEVRADKVASKEFRKLKALLGKIRKDDEIYHGVVNRYCMLRSEELEQQARVDEMTHLLDELREQFDEGLLDNKEYWNHMQSLMAKRDQAERRVDAKREMMFKIERENWMTIASAVKSANAEAADGHKHSEDAMAALLLGRRESANNTTGAM